MSEQEHDTGQTPTALDDVTEARERLASMLDRMTSSDWTWEDRTHWAILLGDCVRHGEPSVRQRAIPARHGDLSV